MVDILMGLSVDLEAFNEDVSVFPEAGLGGGCFLRIGTLPLAQESFGILSGSTLGSSVSSNSPESPSSFLTKAYCLVQTISSLLLNTYIHNRKHLLD